MITKEPMPGRECGLTLAERRAYMKLPLAERRRRLAEQAELMVKPYEAQPEAIEREQWQGGDNIKGNYLTTTQNAVKSV